MPFITSARKEFLEARKAFYVSQLAKLDTAILAGSTEIEEYRFDPGDAAQRVKFRSLEQMSKEITGIEAKLDWINGRLNCTGLVNMGLRR